MSLKHNIIANYISQIYTSLAGILILPMYLKYMGAEAYGLVGFYAMLQVWFTMLDMGLTPGLARETARLNGSAITALNFRNLMRALQLIFLLIMLLGSSSVFLLSGYLTHSWLKVQVLSTSQVQMAIQLMAVSVALRWMSSLYRAIITGAEHFIWLSTYNVVFTTLRYFGVLGVLIYIGTTPILFFSYQLAIACLELLLLANKSYGLLPSLPKSQPLASSFSALIAAVKPILPFSLSIAFTSSIWILITQTDKLILSKLLPLTEYGYFTLAVIAASGVMMISTPISTALMPRMAKLKAEGNEKGLLAVYRHATQLVALIVVPVTLILSFFPEQVLWVWTGNSLAAKVAAPVLRLYALGYGILTFVAFPYYLQYAHGKMKLHLIGNSLFVCTLIPSIIWATFRYGMIGAGWAWFIANSLWLLFWVPIVHKRFAKGLHWKWLLQDIGAVSWYPCLIGLLLFVTLPWGSNSLYTIIEIISASLLTLLSSCLANTHIRGWLINRIHPSNRTFH